LQAVESSITVSSASVGMPSRNSSSQIPCCDHAPGGDWRTELAAAIEEANQDHFVTRVGGATVVVRVAGRPSLVERVHGEERILHPEAARDLWVPLCGLPFVGGDHSGLSCSSMAG
jgi:hypothetical protein